MEEGPCIEVDCQLQFSEFYHAMRWYAWRRYWWHYFALTISVPVGALIGGAFLGQVSSRELLIASAPVAIVTLLVAGFLVWNVYRIALRQFKTSPSIGEIRHWVLSEKGVETSSASSSGKYSWSVLHRIVESPESFLLFSSAVIFIVFPKRILGSEERIESLRALFRQQLGTKAKLRVLERG
jgi:hypothetical protein